MNAKVIALLVYLIAALPAMPKASRGLAPARRGFLNLNAGGRCHFPKIMARTRTTALNGGI